MFGVEWGKCMSTIPQAVIYTDGACQGNPGPGGWAAVVIKDGDKLELSGGAVDTTNNRMELLGVINGLKALPCAHRVKLYSDSKYIINAFNEGWLASWKRNGWARRDGELKNCELWQELDKLSQRHSIAWHWVKGHAGNPNNELCDQLATRQAELFASGMGVEDTDLHAPDADMGQLWIAGTETPDESDEFDGFSPVMGVPENRGDGFGLLDVLKAFDEFVRQYNVEQSGTEQPCGLHDFCDECPEHGENCCAMAYLRYLRAQERGELSHGE